MRVPLVDGKRMHFFLQFLQFLQFLSSRALRELSCALLKKPEEIKYDLLFVKGVQRVCGDFLTF